ncbi:MAG TPA: glucose-6-phosphate dehydrogenase [Clostridia bacterium]|nr:glucose-6-phosphate dehydrogenase [Clostridia bacterium]
MKNKKRETSGYERIFFVFGGTGDLAVGKVLPALHGLYESGAWGEKTALLLVGRKKLDIEQVREKVRRSIYLSKPERGSDDSILRHVHYCSIDMESEESYVQLSEMVESLCSLPPPRVEMMFFLSIPPNLYLSVSDSIRKLGWNREKPAWKRIVVEKPFGTSLDTAIELNERLKTVFAESQIYRIDHYLGKEMIQNIMVIRFANRIFEGFWDRNSIDNVQITVSETSGIKERGGYYDKNGAIKDMIQSHLLQLLSLVAMKKPSCGLDDEIKGERAELLSSLRLFSKEDSENECVIGQYMAYRQESGIPEESMTETFAAIKVNIESDEWKDVPFFLRTGKRLKEKSAYIVVEFKDSCSYFGDYEDRGGKNLLAILIEPDQGVYLKFNIKRPGENKIIMPVSMKFCQSCTFDPHGSPKAYEGLISDVIEGSKSRFAKWDEVSASWAFVDSVERYLDRDRQLLFYEGGGSGPAEAEMLLEREGRAWWEVEAME